MAHNWFDPGQTSAEWFDEEYPYVAPSGGTVTFNVITSNLTAAHPLSINPNATAGDVLITGVVTDSQTSGTPFAETGFDQLALQITTTDSQELVVLRKKNATGSEGALNITNPGSTSMIGFTMALSGADNTTPEDVAVVVVNSNTSGTAPRLIDASITPVTNKCMIVAIVGVDTLDGATDPVLTFSTIAGTTGAWTVRGDYFSNPFRNIAVATCTQTTAGAITVRATASSYVSTAGISMVLMAIRPGAGGGSPTISIIESAAAADSLNAVLTATASLSEVAAAADSSATSVSAQAGIAEAAVAADSASVLLTGNAAIAESAAASDATATAITAPLLLTEASVAADNSALALTATVTVVESAAAADVTDASVSGAPSISVIESSAAADSMTSAAAITINITEPSAAVDSVASVLIALLTIVESSTAADNVALTRAVTINITEPSAAVDSVSAALAAVISIAETSTATDAIITIVAGGATIGVFLVSVAKLTELTAAQTHAVALTPRVDKLTTLTPQVHVYD